MRGGTGGGELSGPPNDRKFFGSVRYRHHASWNPTFDPPYPGLWPWLGVPEALRIADRLETLCFGGWSRAECLPWILMRLYGIYSARNVCMGSTVAAFHA